MYINNTKITLLAVYGGMSWNIEYNFAQTSIILFYHLMLISIMLMSYWDTFEIVCILRLFSIKFLTQFCMNHSFNLN